MQDKHVEPGVGSPLLPLWARGMTTPDAALAGRAKLQPARDALPCIPDDPCAYDHTCKGHKVLATEQRRLLAFVAAEIDMLKTCEARLREAVERVMDAASEDNWCPPDRWKAIKAALDERPQRRADRTALMPEAQ